MLGGRVAGIAAALAVVAAAAVTAGCGGGSALSLDPVAAAATKTQQAGAARIRLALAVSGGVKSLRIQGTGAVDGTSSELNLSVDSKSLEEVSVERDGHYFAYIKHAPLSASLPGGKHWIELDLSKLDESAGLDLQSLLSGSQVQPGDLLSMLVAEGAKIHSLGPATVDGAPTTHYRVTIDTAKALQAKGLTTPLLTGVAAQVPTIPADVWIGKDGLVHRVRVSLGLVQRRLALTMDLYDYGADVNIAPPSSSDVFDATQLARQGMAGAGHWSPYQR